MMGKKDAGLTPKTFPKTPAGEYNVVLKKDGYNDSVNVIRVKKESTATLDAQLVEIHKPIAEMSKRTEPEVRFGMLVPLGPDVIPPKLIKKTVVNYPEDDKGKKLEGTVRLNALVSETGKVIAVRIVQSTHPILDKAAIRCVKEWIYEPPTKQGVAVSVWLPVSFSFRREGD